MLAWTIFDIISSREDKIQYKMTRINKKIMFKARKLQPKRNRLRKQDIAVKTDSFKKNGESGYFEDETLCSIC